MRTIAITGANRGIGLMFAQHYAEAGARVIACCRRPETFPPPLLGSSNIVVRALDVADAASCERFAQDCAEETIDTLILNAGANKTPAGLGQFTDDEWRYLFELHTIGPLRLVRLLLPALLRSAAPRVIGMTSRLASIAELSAENRGFRLRGASYPYRTTKCSANLMLRLLALEMAGSNLVTLSIDPGWVRTEMGGAEAPIAAAESVAKMSRLIDRVSAAESGQFVDLEGNTIPW
jgi:NAD(P)-dependent dehydrogenase (short-subunit alcohol dehydrogenase family)